MKATKILSVLLAMLMLCSCFVSCGDDTPVNTGDGTGIADTTVDGEQLGVPTTADFGGEEFNILSSGNIACNDFDFEEESTLALDNAQYKRKRLVEQNYNIVINEEVKVSNSTGSGYGFMQISNAVNSGECDYDLALIAGYDVSVLAYNNYLYDMNSIPGIDLTKSWWDQKANESLAVQGVMFFTTGEITVSDNNAAFVIMFNKELVSDYELESPYELVYDGQWTMEKFASMCKTVTEDLNQDGMMGDDDRFGLLVWDDSIVGIVNAAGERCCTVNEQGVIELTIYNETTLQALETYLSIANDTQYAYTYQRHGNGIAYEQRLWSGNHGLFWTTYMGIVPKFREMESDFGLLPYPKLTEEQDTYYTTIAPWNSQFICVPLYQNDVERTGIITEALAYYGKQISTPAYYDVNLIGQTTRDEESSDMLEIIFDNLVFDFGYLYRVGSFNKQLMDMIRQFDTNFTSRYDRYKTSAEMMLKIINEEYTAAVESWK